MFDYNYYRVNGEVVRLKDCENRLCSRLTTAMYCCHSCDKADQGDYEIHEIGTLGHSDECNIKAEQRAKAKLV